MGCTDGVPADSQVRTADSKQSTLASKFTPKDKKLRRDCITLLVLDDSDSKQTTPAAKKPCSVPGKSMLSQNSNNVLYEVLAVSL